jgi:hypothetical protein
MPNSTAVDKLYEEVTAVIKMLEQSPEVSLQITAGDHFRKALLLAAASYFENRVCALVLGFVSERTGGSALVENFVKNKAIARQYHTWFKWEENNANQFFGLFGSEFRVEMINRVKASDDLRTSVRAFLELGNERNKLVHQDYATFPLNKTLDEIYALYRGALIFVEQLPSSLRDSDRLHPEGSTAQTRTTALTAPGNTARSEAPEGAAEGPNT